tara:strand:+ start:308 stop:451 length:144 start_codon:yes stop_codon:yes gene_type:complete
MKYKNGTPVSRITEEKLQKFINEICKIYPNDQDLGAMIRKLRTYEVF